MKATKISTFASWRKLVTSLSLVFFGIQCFPNFAFAATCYGSPDCRACKTCSSCGHCNSGGAPCGVYNFGRRVTNPTNSVGPSSVNHLYRPNYSQPYRYTPSVPPVTNYDAPNFQVPHQNSSEKFSDSQPQFKEADRSAARRDSSGKIKTARKVLSRKFGNDVLLELSDTTKWKLSNPELDSITSWNKNDEILVVGNDTLINVTKNDEAVKVSKYAIEN